MSGVSAVQVWVIDDAVNDATLERLGDARGVADRLGSRVGVLLTGDAARSPASAYERLIGHGADHVIRILTAARAGSAALQATLQVLPAHAPRLVLASGEVHGREWAARLAAAAGWKLVSPVLQVQVRDGRIEATGLDRTGRLSRRVGLEAGESAVVTLRPGVGEALAFDPARTGVVEQVELANVPTEAVKLERIIPADPATVDIRHANRLVAGGRGLGGKEGFDALRQFAAKLSAGVAASRMVVDLGWIAHERQVGQTGKTVRPDLYIACGISGASHHLEGMADARHIVAINTDPDAPIFKIAHLGLVADLYETLKKTEEGLKP